MGYHKLPAIKHYWSSSPTLGVPFIANVMARDRFQQILTALHFGNNKHMPQKSDPEYDRGLLNM